ncbi:STAS domain-containing protein [Kibdelosporangium phytohabitans]|uniref:STAS domain-containing protein n=1 Tax=Kibdelosporangium phytohabitans TaxID=860235 RepID=A0A0N9I4C1_9PSEU|nr:STAS domain-containing protein [Kibdelosporangium phytohabitans]ALG09387.1 hypothetical protein AOZ06_22950 [Kibdelosporangium phytohabitans]MBE1469343.1 anti-anti-sigma factor [Kibdelosporangium phytohabitans]
MAPTNRPIPDVYLSDPHMWVTARTHQAESTTIVHVRGQIDASTSRVLDHHLHTRVPPDSRFVVVDLTEVDLLGASGIRLLLGHADRLATSGRHLLTVADAEIRRLLDATDTATILRAHPTLCAALASRPRSTVAAAGGAETIRAALELLLEHHGVTDEDLASALLRDVAYRLGTTVEFLAGALLSAPESHRTVRHFTLPPPQLTFGTRANAHRGVILDQFLGTVLGYTAAEAADIAAPGTAAGALRLDHHKGMSAGLVTHLRHEGHWLTTAALRRIGPVTVSVTGKHPVFNESTTRHLLRDAGIESVTCVPLRTRTGRCKGVMSTYHTTPARRPNAMQQAKLDHAAGEVTAWLEWHQRFIVHALIDQVCRVTDQGFARD